MQQSDYVAGFAIRLSMHAMKWKLACFDLDGTLVRHTSTGQHIAEKLGHAVAMSEIERKYVEGLATNADVAALDGQYYKGLTKADISKILDDIPVINDIARTVDWLKEKGISSVVCTIAWKFVGEVFAERYGFIASSGPTLKIDQNGVFTGEVGSDFTEHDKPVFVSSLCHNLQISISDVFHIGDSRSDIPLFGAVGFSVALNANQQAKEKANIALETDSLFDVLHVIPGLKS